MINDILHDIEEAEKVSPSELFEKLVNKRLNDSLKSYYHDIHEYVVYIQNRKLDTAVNMMSKDLEEWI